MEHYNHAALVQNVIYCMEHRITIPEVDFPLSWILKTNIKQNEIYPDLDTIRSGIIDDNYEGPVPLYRSTRNTSTTIDFNWLWTRRTDEKFFHIIKPYFLNNFVHTDITYLGIYGFSEVIKIRENIAKAQNLLRKVFNKAVEKRKLKKRLQIYRSLFHRLNNDVIGEIQKFI